MGFAAYQLNDGKTTLENSWIPVVLPSYFKYPNFGCNSEGDDANCNSFTCPRALFRASSALRNLGGMLGENTIKSAIRAVPVASPMATARDNEDDMSAKLD